MIIVVSGTPGTGKTKLAKALAERMNHKYVDVTALIKKENIGEKFDKRRNCRIVDISNLNKALISLIAKHKKLIIDSHLAHFLSKKYVDHCVITTCDLKTLQKRLVKRGYSPEKVRENLDAEIFDVCLTEAIETGHKVTVIDTKKRIAWKKLIEDISL